MTLPSRGLYAITSETICIDTLLLLRAVSQAIDGGAVLIQYRDKLNVASIRHRNALHLQALCSRRGVALLINDGPAEAVAEFGFDGMHLGDDDGAIHAARKLCPQALIGATCGHSLPRARQAHAEGCSYVAFGAFYSSVTKPKAPRAPIDLLFSARQEFQIPICAIGGITPENAPALIAAGANYIAVVNGVFGQPDIAAAARAYAKLFEG